MNSYNNKYHNNNINNNYNKSASTWSDLDLIVISLVTSIMTSMGRWKMPKMIFLDPEEAKKFKKNIIGYNIVGHPDKKFLK